MAAGKVPSPLWGGVRVGGTNAYIQENNDEQAL
jgi:hypothetical protein